MSKRVTPPKRTKRSRKSAHLARYGLVSRHTNASRGDQAKVLAEAIDGDPFEIIGFASIATAAMRSDIGELFDDLARQDPRLGPTLWATVAAMPFIDCYAPSEPTAAEHVPAWLRQLDRSRITGVLRRTEDRQRHRSTYLVETTMFPELVTTCVFDLRHMPNSEISGFRTIAAPIGDVADFYQKKHRRTCDQAYTSVPLAEACQNLLIALDESLHAGSCSTAARPPWPLNMPTAAFVIELAMGQIRADDVLPYLAMRRGAGATNPASTELRRSLATWPALPTPPTPPTPARPYELPYVDAPQAGSRAARRRAGRSARSNRRTGRNQPVRTTAPRSTRPGQRRRDG